MAAAAAAAAPRHDGYEVAQADFARLFAELAAVVASVQALATKDGERMRAAGEAVRAWADGLATAVPVASATSGVLLAVDILSTATPAPRRRSSANKAPQTWQQEGARRLCRWLQRTPQPEPQPQPQPPPAGTVAPPAKATPDSGHAPSPQPQLQSQLQLQLQSQMLEIGAVLGVVFPGVC